ncbi:MAG TPA: response regulator transcription factor [Azospirillum sp.]|nr:response regulator transcription factor [Azospirillum sp.]
MNADAKPRDIVLVVDDSPETLSFLTDALEEAGVTVLVALDGPSALSLVDRVTPDVVLMDAVMPGLDGFETCRRIKRDSRVAHVPVIFMTGLSETEHIVAGFQAGGVDYVTKPIVADQLLARMHTHLANARVAQSTRAALDATGRTLLATDGGGRVLWCTPQASRMLGMAFEGVEQPGYTLPPAACDWLRRHLEGKAPDAVVVDAERRALRLRITPVGRIGADEILLQLAEDTGGGDTDVLKRKLPLTAREAEVLSWIAGGKSNRDIAEILGLSPRTVDKHLEQIYAKLGVENRASAAAVAVRALNAS